jgi:hypothetical protein
MLQALSHVMHTFPWNEGEKEKMCPILYADKCPACQAFFNFQPWASGYHPQHQGFKLQSAHPLTAIPLYMMVLGVHTLPFFRIEETNKSTA